MKTIALILNSSKACYYFRRELISSLQKKAYKVIVVAGDNIFEKELVSLGVLFYCVPMTNRSINPFKMKQYQNRLTRLLKSVKPNIVFCFQIKPISFGVVAAKKSGVKNIYSMVEGLGDSFSKDSLKFKFISLFVSKMLKRSFRLCNKCFVMNKEDILFLEKKKILQYGKAILINGTGIDPFEYNYKSPFNFETVVMISRLIKNKGVFDFCDAARIIKQTNKNICFYLIGYESDIQKKDIQTYIDDGSIEYLGVVPNLIPILEKMSIFVLPTFYNEGFPRSILEAMAIGRPVVTTNTKGCNVAVKNHINGLLVEPHNPNELAKQILFLLNNKQKIIEYGLAGRKMVEDNFNSNNISNSIIADIEKNLLKTNESGE